VNRNACCAGFARRAPPALWRRRAGRGEDYHRGTVLVLLGDADHRGTVLVLLGDADLPPRRSGYPDVLAAGVDDHPGDACGALSIDVVFDGTGDVKGAHVSH
jgi:hypothetical protein